MTAARRHRAWTLAGTAALSAVLAVAATIAWATGDGGPGRAKAIGVAAGISLAGSLGGWLAGRCRPAEPARAVSLGLAALGLRIFPALAGLVWIRSAGGELADAGAAEWLLIFYLALLATDVLLHIMGSGRGAAVEN